MKQKMLLRKNLPLKTIVFLFTLAYIFSVSFILLSYYSLGQNPFRNSDDTAFSHARGISQRLYLNYWQQFNSLEIEDAFETQFDQIRLSQWTNNNLKTFAEDSPYVEFQVRLLPGDGSGDSQLPSRVLYQTEGYRQARSNPEFDQVPIRYSSSILNLGAYAPLFSNLTEQDSETDTSFNHPLDAADRDSLTPAEISPSETSPPAVPTDSSLPQTELAKTAEQTLAQSETVPAGEARADSLPSEPPAAPNDPSVTMAEADMSAQKILPAYLHTLTFSIYTNEDLLSKSPEFSNEFRLFQDNLDFIHSPYTQFSGIALFGVLFLISLIYLFVAAGWHPQHDGVHLPKFQRFPADLMLAAYVLLTFLCVRIGMDLSDFESSWLIHFPEFQLIGAGLLTFLFFLLLSFLIHATAQIKNGGFVRSTLIYRIARLIGKGLRAFFRALPLIWRNLLLLAVLFAAEFFLLQRTRYGETLPIYAFILLNLLILIGLIHSIIAYNKIRRAITAISEGDMDYRLDTRKLSGNFRQMGEQLNQIQSGMSAAIRERLKSERFKTELITNVSHDIKTPLTSIITYTDLLAKETIDNEEAVQYIDVLKRQGVRLKKLIEDLIEASKASTGNLTVNLAPLNLREMVAQAHAEYQGRFEQEKLNLIVTVSDDISYVLADGRYLWRVLDNLLNNVVKHALPDTRVYLDVYNEQTDYAMIRLRNVSAEQLNITAEELMQRFVQGDRSRNKGGSGLGLSIAQSLMELQGGELIVQIDGDLYTAMIRLPKVQTYPVDLPSPEYGTSNGSF